jgi:hypothetical protein
MEPYKTSKGSSAPWLRTTDLKYIVKNAVEFREERERGLREREVFLNLFSHTSIIKEQFFGAPKLRTTVLKQLKITL